MKKNLTPVVDFSDGAVSNADPKAKSSVCEGNPPAPAAIPVVNDGGHDRPTSSREVVGT